MKTCCYIGLSLMLTLLAAPITRAAETNTPPDELLEKDFLCGVAQHLYRWYMDEIDVEKNSGTEHMTFLVRNLNPVLDANDHSLLAEIVLPDFDIRVTLKKADYEIPELNTIVKTDHFKIIRVSREGTDSCSDCVSVEVPYQEMAERLFRMRNQVAFPGTNLAHRLRGALAHQLEKDNQENRGRDSTGEQVVHLAPLSPVANEVWVFWETGRLLIRFASDIDLNNPSVWDHEDLAVTTYDVDEQVVVSLHEAAGSNAYLTRDQVGRALYNCVILGKRIAVVPQKDAGETR